TPAQVPLRIDLLHQFLKWHVLVRICFQRYLFLPLDQFSETRIPSEVGPKDQRVDEKSDQPFDFFPGAVRDHGSDTEILLSAVPHQDHLEGCHQQHKQRRSFPPAESPQTLAQFIADRYFFLTASIARGRRSCMVSRQLEDGCVLKSLLPVPDLSFHHLSGQVLALPLCIVGVLNLQLLERR